MALVETSANVMVAENSETLLKHRLADQSERVRVQFLDTSKKPGPGGRRLMNYWGRGPNSTWNVLSLSRLIGKFFTGVVSVGVNRFYIVPRVAVHSMTAIVEEILKNKAILELSLQLPEKRCLKNSLFLMVSSQNGRLLPR